VAQNLSLNCSSNGRDMWCNIIFTCLCSCSQKLQRECCILFILHFSAHHSSLQQGQPLSWFVFFLPRASKQTIIVQDLDNIISMCFSKTRMQEEKHLRLELEEPEEGKRVLLQQRPVQVATTVHQYWVPRELSTVQCTHLHSYPTSQKPNDSTIMKSFPAPKTVQAKLKTVNLQVFQLLL